MPLTPTEFAIYKAEATGNDFLIVDLLSSEAQKQWRDVFANSTRGEFVKRISDRHFGLGADGVVFLEPATGFDFAWDFYNNDGGVAEMCGNAARAVALYICLRTGKHELRFATRIGPVQAQVSSMDDIEVELPSIREEKWGPDYDFVNSGVPHVLVPRADLSDHKKMREEALALKRRPEFAQTGTNVTFLTAARENKIESVTFERGVEDFTLACGTGAIAAAHSILRGQESHPLEVRVPGGVLTVEFRHKKPHLRGPARVLARMHWIKE